MKTPARFLMVLFATAAVVVAAWQVRPGAGSEAADAALVTTPAAAVSPLPVAGVSGAADPGTTMVVVDESPTDAFGRDVWPDDSSDADSVESSAESGSGNDQSPEEATPADGYVSAAPLNIETREFDDANDNPQSTQALDCWSYISEEIRRDEAGLIDWDALDTYIELSEDDYTNLDVEFVSFDEAMLADGDRPNFAGMSGPVDVGSLDVVRLLAVTDRCWELGVYEQIAESIYTELYADE